MNNELFFNRTEKQTLLAEIESGRFSHAYLIEGDEGTGKTHFALFAARAILCGGENKPCGKCPSCIKAGSNSHPDLFVFSPEKKATLGVDTVREIKKSVYFLPNDGDKKVYIIDEADKMTLQAQNALLKFLEEPPASTVFFLIANKKESLLPTVVSRTRVITLAPSHQDDIFSFLRAEVKNADEGQIKAAVSMSEGSVGRAQKLLLKDFGKRRELCLGFVPIMFGASKGDAMGFLLSMKQTREGVKEFFSLLLTAVSDVTNVKLGIGKTRLLEFDTAKEYAKRVTDRRLAYLSELIIDAAVSAAENANVNLLLSAFAARL